MYCHCCIHFGTHASDSGDLCFIRNGYNTWGKAVGNPRKGLDKHARSADHLTSEAMWQTYSNQTVTIIDRLSSHREELIESNRQYFTILIKHIRYLVVQQIPYRHIDEHDESATNQGNLVELLKVQCQTNPTFDKLREKVERQYSVHTNYWSKTIFNEIVEIMANLVRNGIARDIAIS